MYKILVEIYHFFVFPFWLLCLLVYFIDMILRFSGRIEEFNKISNYQIICCAIFIVIFILLLSMANFIDTIVLVATIIYSIGTYILPYFKIYNYNFLSVIKRIFKIIGKWRK